MKKSCTAIISRGLLVALFFICAAITAAPKFEFKAGDVVAFLGDGLMEQEQYHGWIETALATRFPDREVKFRNLGWNADTPTGQSRFGLSLLQAGREPDDEGWKQLQAQIGLVKPTVVIVGYGMASSLEGGAGGLETFRRDYETLLDTVAKISPGVRFVLLGPIRHENGFKTPAKEHNKVLQAYSAAIAKIATTRKLPFVSLFDAEISAAAGDRVTRDGIHLTGDGYRSAALAIERALFGEPGKWSSSPNVESLRSVILRKNEWWFHRSRPANMAYVFGFRKREQGQNAVEIPQFDALIAAEEVKIAKLRALKPVMMEQPTPRVESKYAKFTPQPRPEFITGEGLEVTLFAENPQLNKPIHMNFDPQGRLWVASSETYPMIEVGQAANDKIIVLEDTDGDGVSDRSTVFADGLLMPTGVEPGDGGVYVAQSTDLLHLTDTDGNGLADTKRRVLSGFGTEDTHHNLHTLRWGPDGRLYMNQSVYTRTDTETPHGVSRLHAGGGFRLNTDTMEMGIFFRGLWNAWGHQFDEYGQSFMTDGAGFAGIAWVFPGARFNPTPNTRRVMDLISPGKYPKFASLEIVQSRAFPADWQGSIVTCDFRANRVTRFSLSDNGAGFVTRQEADILRTANPTFRPIDVKLGPDGALYIADWSNPIINHGEVDFRDPRRDRWHGRIWRVAAKDGVKVRKRDLTRLLNEELLDLLNSPDRFDRDHARRVLAERGKPAVGTDLKRWTDAQSTESGQLAALWMHQSLGIDQPVLLQKALSAKDAKVRAAAVRVASDAPGNLASLKKRVADPHPRVRLEAVRSLSRFNSLEAAETILTVLNHSMDPFLDYATWLAVNELDAVFLAALHDGQWSPNTAAKEKQLEFVLQAIEPAKAGDYLARQLAKAPLPRDGAGPWIELVGKAGGRAELAKLYEQAVLDGFDPDTTRRALTALAEAQRLRNTRPIGKLDGIQKFVSHEDIGVRVAAATLAGAWRQGALIGSLMKLAGDPKSTDPLRNAAFASLREIGGGGAAKGLESLTAKSNPPHVRRHAVMALSGLDVGAASKAFYDIVETATDAESLQLWRTLLQQRGADAAMVKNFPGKISQSAARSGLRAARETGRDVKPLIATLTPHAGLTIDPESLTPQRLAALSKDVIAKGDPARGERVYRRQELGCTLCHSIGGIGGQVGPDMTSIGAAAPVDYLIESLFNPNAKIKEGFHSVTIETKDDSEFSGIEVSESASEIVLRNAANQLVSVPKNNIAKKRNGLSLMPAGLLDILSESERLDLVAFLSRLGKPGEFDATRKGIARQWQVLPFTHRMDQDGWDRATKQGFDATWQPMENGLRQVLSWAPMATRVNGSLPQNELEKLAEVPFNVTLTSLFLGTQFTVNDTKVVRINIQGATTSDIWIDGRKAKIQDLIRGGNATLSTKVDAGNHRLIIRLDGSQKMPKQFTVQSDDVNFSSN
jgi:putative heme-binding domain-containing protein